MKFKWKALAAGSILGLLAAIGVEGAAGEAIANIIIGLL